jgi:hypothetical protein
LIVRARDGQTIETKASAHVPHSGRADPAVSFLCPSQLDTVRFRQLFQRFSKTVRAGLLIVKLLWRLQLTTPQPN